MSAPAKRVTFSETSVASDSTITPEAKMTAEERMVLKKLIKKFKDIDDDDEGLEDSPIGRRKNGDLKRRRTSKGDDKN